MQKTEIITNHVDPSVRLIYGNEFYITNHD